MAKVSFIMGAYNIEKNKGDFFDAIMSIQNQTFNDFEIVICNDGSTDCTTEILDQLSDDYQNVKVIHNKKNGGLASALNCAIQVATGEYLARMDTDDLCEPNRLEKQVAFLEQHPEVSFVGSNISYFDDQGEWNPNVAYKERPTKKDFLWSNPFAHPSIMIRKKALLSVDGYTVQKRTRRCEDYDLYCKLYERNLIGVNIPEVLLRYRYNRNGEAKRLYKYRVDEFWVRMDHYQKLGLMPMGIMYALKPLVVGLIPQKVLTSIKKVTQ